MLKNLSYQLVIHYELLQISFYSINKKKIKPLELKHSNFKKLMFL